MLFGKVMKKLNENIHQQCNVSFWTQLCNCNCTGSGIKWIGLNTTIYLDHEPDSPPFDLNTSIYQYVLPQTVISILNYFKFSWCSLSFCMISATFSRGTAPVNQNPQLTICRLHHHSRNKAIPFFLCFAPHGVLKTQSVSRKEKKCHRKKKRFL